MRVLGISGSLRRDSYNSMLLRAAAELLPSGVELEVYDGLKAIPPYDADDEAVHDPSVHALREAIAEADAVLIATPEYNASVPGVLKNALDWVSRPHATNSLRGKPVAEADERFDAHGNLDDEDLRGAYAEILSDLADAVESRREALQRAA